MFLVALFDLDLPLNEKGHRRTQKYDASDSEELLPALDHNGAKKLAAELELK